jgi:hypothetical protein
MFKRAQWLVLLAVAGLFSNGVGAVGITLNPPTVSAPPAGSECRYAPVRGGPCWTTEDVIDTRIDHHAQTGLLRMFTRGANWAAEASAILCAVKTGALEGVHLPDQQAPALRARDAGSGWWNIIPKGQNGVCYQQPPGRAPMIVFGKPVKDNPDLTANALADAWRQCGLQASAPRCYTATISKPAAAGATASATLVVRPLSNFSEFRGAVTVDWKRGSDPQAATTGTGTITIPVEPGVIRLSARRQPQAPGEVCANGPLYEIKIATGETLEIRPQVPPCDDSGRQQAEPPVPESGGL